MKKRSLSLFLMLALGAAGAQTSPAVASADARLSKSNVTFRITRDGGNLTALLTAVAKSAGYELVLDPALDTMSTAGAGAAAEAGSPATNASTSMLTYDFAGKPFNQVWPFLMDVYGLNYEVVRLGNQDVLRVGRSPIQKIIALPRTLDTALVENRVKLAFGTRKVITEKSGSDAASSSSTRDDIVLDSPTLKIVGEPTSSSLIVRGTNKEVREVEALVTQIVAAQPPELVKTVTPASPVIQQIYAVKGEQADAEAVIKSQFPGINVTAVGKTGKLVLSGQKILIDTALALLAQVDRPAQLTASPDSKQQVYAVQGNQKDIATLLSAQFPGLKITPVGTTGQLVLNGASDQIDEALALLEQVDQPVTNGPGIQQKVFQLVNASAEELKAVLDNTLQTALTASPTTAPLPNVPVNAVDANGNVTTLTTPNPALQNPTTPTATTAQAKPSGDVATIIADKRTNTLIVRGTALQVEQVATLIPSLDQVVPQINVQVRIQEITQDAARTLGLDWKVGFGGFNVSSGAKGLSASFDPTRALVGGFNLLPTLNALETQTQTKRIYDGSISMQSGQRSLGLTGNSFALNASNGAAASIKSGGRLEINVPSSSGNISRQIDYGINLDFFNPQVAPDGSITIRVRGQINQPKSPITGSTLPSLLDFSNSEAQSVVTFKSGQTLLLSGLLGTNETSVTRGTPFLSSLPVIGAAFGQKETSKTATQLLVVITGTVVK
ncbi:secretin N-terminal domain-containing protein [Deinococcus sp.]|uniref:type II secretion system protein GspD n=1 Tax=Deinococcus sp. TaxID=47478 RepID=UPI0025EAE883|nr:secretin N-terminal domain-containing protein [Deinococcus sp.]